MPNQLSSAGALLADFHAAIDVSSTEDMPATCARFLSPAAPYRGMRPFYEQTGPADIAAIYAPFKAAMTTWQRRPDIHFASHDHLSPDAAIWAVSMGTILGDFTAPWLGIPPTDKATALTYVTMAKVEGGQITELVEFFDILSVLTQAGLNPYADVQSGAHRIFPGPKTHDGLGPHDASETEATHALTTAMLDDLAKSYTSPADHMARFWHPDMNWFGPTGIGTSLGFPGYRRGHTGPFEEKLDTTDIVDWEIATAQGRFSAVMWWPCLRMRNIGGYMGAPVSDKLADMRVIDLYRRDGDKLAENWIFIDMLHFLAGQGIDLLANIGGAK
ncbi:MAG: ester cyclase [Pseudomonadota bacterium]